MIECEKLISKDKFKKINKNIIIKLTLLIVITIIFFVSMLWTTNCVYSDVKTVTGTITFDYDRWTCLIKGTEVTLANGDIKNIEDVNYDDLLLVWNFDLGSYDYSYPVFIQKSGEINHYVKLTFDDESTICYSILHNFFDVDENLFIDFTEDNYLDAVNRNLFKNNINSDGIISSTSAKVINAEIVYENSFNYFLSTAEQFNSFSNGFLTSVSPSLLANGYGFDENMINSSVKNEVINGSCDSETGKRYDYSVVSEIIPYYLYLGFKVDESRYLVDSGYLIYEELIYTIASLLVDKCIDVPTQSNMINEEEIQTRVWAVSTSNEFENLFNDDYEKTHIFEGDYYILPEPNEVTRDGKSFIGWRSNADNQIYDIGDNVQIWFGTHFEAVYN